MMGRVDVSINGRPRTNVWRRRQSAITLRRREVSRPAHLNANFYLRATFEQIRSALSPRRRWLRDIRAEWGRLGTKDAWLASRYFELTRGAVGEQVDDKTWADLELPKVFADIDTTATRIGSQVLFRTLRVYVEDSRELAERYEMYAKLRTDAALREEIQLKLVHLQQDSTALLADYLFGPPPPENARLLVPVLLWSLLSALTLVGAVFLFWPLFPWLAILAINAVVVFRLSSRLNRDVDSLKACGRLIKIADSLATLAASSPQIPALARLADQSAARLHARSTIRWFTIQHTNELAESLFLWLNFAFLLEPLSYLRAADKFASFRAVLASTYELVGSLDAAVAVASLLERQPEHCQPTVAAGSLLELEDAYHPLIARPVKNSIRLDGRSALITGSNMAGKTTFIKTVGLNLVLGQTLGLCFASAAVLPRSPAQAAIRGEHSVESGRSHYFAEVEAIRSFLEGARQGRCRVFLIDELLSGTNAVERIATARAVLESLSSNAQVLVTTHDVELQALLGERFELYHFREDPSVEGFFDYRLRPGRATERNAIRLLARMGFPDDIVSSALSFAARDADGGP
jgi:DNA mismatch repair ATPase MutS